MHSGKIVLIQMDHVRRDAASSLLLSRYLNEHGVKSVLCNRFNTKELIRRYNPELVVLTHPFGIFTPEELKQLSERTDFVLLHPESSGLEPESMILAMGGRASIKASNILRHVLVWGQRLKDILIESNTYREDQISVIGSPRYDFYLADKNESKSSLGMMTSFTGISRYDNRNIFNLIHQAESNRGSLYPKWGGYEDYLWTSAAFARIFLEFMDVWCNEMGRDVNLRPYTLENIADYRYFKEKYKNKIVLDSVSPFPQWLAGKYANIFCYSSSVSESIISKVPYICVQGMIEERLEYHQPRSVTVDTRGGLHDYVYRPKNLNELVELSEKAHIGKLPLAFDIDNSNVAKIMWEYYGYPQERPATESACEIIINILEGHNPNKRFPSIIYNDSTIMGTLRTLKCMYEEGLVTTLDYHTIRNKRWLTRYVSDTYNELKLRYS